MHGRHRVSHPSPYARGHPLNGFTTRFAPAPTGYLHLGHAVNAVWVWGLARAFGGRVLLRVEDHDRGRCRKEYELALLDDLDWLGLMPDEPTTSAFRDEGHRIPLRQSDNTERYVTRLGELERAGRAFVCTCPRSERYPGTCRYRRLDPAVTPARRVIIESGHPEQFIDMRLGEQTQDPDLQCGDVPVRDRTGNWTYHFAVVVDDFEQGVDMVIRGEDLLDSTGRQLRLARMIGRGTPPRFLHHPLVRKADGQKLSKSSRDTGLRDLRDAGHSPQEVLGIAAHYGGLQASPLPVDVGTLPDLLGAWARQRALF